MQPQLNLSVDSLNTCEKELSFEHDEKWQARNAHEDHDHFVISLAVMLITSHQTKQATYTKKKKRKLGDTFFVIVDKKTRKKLRTSPHHREPPPLLSVAGWAVKKSRRR